MQRAAVFVCSFGYIGFVPVAPGTVGSAAVVLLHLVFRHFNSSDFELPLIFLLFALGTYFGAAAEKALGGIDPGPVVIDEVMGMLVAFLLIPLNWTGLLAGFVLFRFFDVIKPY